MNLNTCYIAGNLTRDPEIRYTPKGTAICKIGVAINRKWKSDSGEPKEEVTFVDCEALGRTAENIGNFFKKGRCIFIIGRLKTDSWEDKASGQKRSKLGVVVESFQFVDSKQETPATESAPQAITPPLIPNTEASKSKDDDVPF